MNSALVCYHETPDGRVKVYQGDARRMLEVLPEKSVQCVVTSPPYWCLRKYEGEQDLIWDGKADCEHQWYGKGLVSDKRGVEIIQGKTRTTTRFYGDDSTRTWSEVHQKHWQDCFCFLCGAWRGAFGLETSVELYIVHSMLFLDLLWKVLKDNGCVFWDLGDSYGGVKVDNTETRKYPGAVRDDFIKDTRRSDIKPKSLCLIPERFALAAQERGWIVRSRIALVKPNPMPESVTDRPTGSWETIWMLTKGPRYYWDQEAVRRPLANSSWARCEHAVKTKETYSSGRHKTDMEGFTQSPTEVLTRAAQGVLDKGSANLRDVWEFPTEPFSGAHFAVFPRELVRRCVLAATSEKGNCSRCGKPWVRIIEKEPSKFNVRVRDAKAGKATAAEGYKASQQELDNYEGADRATTGWTKTLGWKPTCACDTPTEPALVLDPFSGSGTTLEVAYHLGRRAVGFDLSATYCDLAVERLKQGAMTFSE